jgi:chemotaxis protein methyltransferase WspC
MNAGELLQRETGLDLAPALVERAVAARMAASGHTSSADYLRLMTAVELTALIELVVVPESWMFRDAAAFAAAADFARERLAAAPGRTLRFLSAPCAGGEEPYTIAMALQEAGIARSAYVIDAIDLSAASIARARQGSYTRNAFRGAQLAFRDRHFSRDGANYQISDALRQQVNFAQGNLLAFDISGQAGRYDVIFCRNLLIYFDEPTAAAAIARLHTLLAADGMLFAGYAEVPAFCQNGFASVRRPGAFALQKSAPHALVARAQPVAVHKRMPRPAPAPAAPGKRMAPPPRAPAAALPAPDAAALLEQARRLADQGELAASAAACHGALQADPHCAQAYFILGMVSDCRSDSSAAGEYWRRCVYLQPDHYDALCHLAMLAEQQGQATRAAQFRQRAARVYQRADKVSP